MKGGVVGLYDEACRRPVSRLTMRGRTRQDPDAKPAASTTVDVRLTVRMTRELADALNLVAPGGAFILVRHLNSRPRTHILEAADIRIVPRMHDDIDVI